MWLKVVAALVLIAVFLWFVLRGTKKVEAITSKLANAVKRFWGWVGKKW